MNFRSFLNCVVIQLMISSTFLLTATAQVSPPVKPTVSSPSVNGAAAPQTPSAGGAPPAAPAAAPQNAAQTAAPARALLPAAPLVATKFEDGSYKQQIEAGTTVLLLFSELNDPIWTKQASVLQGVLKEAEFGRIAVFQIDIGANPAVADRFLVKTPGTLVVLKSGVERLRSTRMTKADVIRKMLRLHTAL